MYNHFKKPALDAIYLSYIFHKYNQCFRYSTEILPCSASLTTILQTLLPTIQEFMMVWSPTTCSSYCWLGTSDIRFRRTHIDILVRDSLPQTSLSVCPDRCSDLPGWIMWLLCWAPQCSTSFSARSFTSSFFLMDAVGAGDSGGVLLCSRDFFTLGERRSCWGTSRVLSPEICGPWC